MRATRTLALAGMIAPVLFITLVIVILLLFVTLGWFALADDAPLHPWAGLLQRVVCAVWFTCTIVFAVRLRRLA